MEQHEMPVMKVNLIGRIGNIPLGVTHSLIPLFEAVVNSIQAIKALDRTDGKIEILVSRDESQALLSDAFLDTRPVVGFTITDNGIGFDDDNFESFTTSDTKYKPGAKGVGRFMWLKAFEKVEIDSMFARNSNRFKRIFDFTLSPRGIENVSLAQVDSEKKRSTAVRLVGFKERYQRNCPKRLELIAERLIEHCMIYFLSDKCPSISISDKRSHINLNQHFNDNVKGNTNAVGFFISDQLFKLVHLRLYFTNEKNHQAHICGNERVVESMNLGKRIPDLNATLTDEEDRMFKYSAIITSEYLDENVNAERAGFNIPRHSDDLFDEGISMDAIESETVREVKNFLTPYLAPVKQQKAAYINQIVETKYPQYRSTIKNMPEALDRILPDLPEERLEIELHKLRYQYSTELKEATQNFINSAVSKADDVPSYFEEYKTLLSKISEVSADQLAEYVLYRKAIISLLEKSVELSESGKYPLEEVVHKIIFPMITTSNEIDYEQQNLWLIDERLTYHHFLASDKPLNTVEVLNTESGLEPDLIVFNNALAYAEAPVPFSSVVIVEFKRPMRTNYLGEENPFEQVIRYITKIRESNALDRKGRPIIVNDNTPFYAYIICDPTEKLKYLAQNSFDYTPTPDGLGYFNFNKNLKAYIEVITYTKLVQDARKRNRVLFEKLNLPNS
jgi:hypothetical protein